MDLRDVVHHDVHASQLTPDLGKDADMGAVDHVWLEELKVGDIGICPFKFADIPDLLELTEYEWRVWVTMTMD